MHRNQKLLGKYFAQIGTLTLFFPGTFYAAFGVMVGGGQKCLGVLMEGGVRKPPQMSVVIYEQPQTDCPPTSSITLSKMVKYDTLCGVNLLLKLSAY